jgi:hypothetical protein
VKSTVSVGFWYRQLSLANPAWFMMMTMKLDEPQNFSIHDAV